MESDFMKQKNIRGKRVVAHDEEWILLHHLTGKLCLAARPGSMLPTQVYLIEVPELSDPVKDEFDRLEELEAVAMHNILGKRVV